MALHKPRSGESLGLARGSTAICMLSRGVSDLLPRCLDGVLVHTPPEVPILLMDDCSPDESVEAVLRSREPELGDRDIFFLRQSRSVGFAANMNVLFQMAAPADVLILNDDCEVAEGWFEGLRAAAFSDSTIASATALTNHGSILSIPERNRPVGGLPPGWTVDSAAAAIRRASRRLYPWIAAMVGHCAYIKRSALDLVGDFDLAFSPGYGEEVDFSQRCILRGLSHVAADDVFVLHKGSATFSARAEKLKADHEELIAQRYPYYHGMVHVSSNSRSGPLARALGIANRALVGLSATIDGSCLYEGPITGTQVHILELIQALHRTGEVRLRVAVPRNCADYAQDVLDSLEGVRQIVIDDVDEGTERTDLVHRPFQIGTVVDLLRLRLMGDRVVITQQDLIAFRNPGYFRSFEDWERYRQCTRLALKHAERVAFFSGHAACEAEKEELVDRERSCVVNIGVDHHLTRPEVEPQRPATSLALEDRDFVLSLGVDFVHKNRLFAIQVLEQLQARHGWTGCLVLAGPQASPGSSAALDEGYLRARPQLAAATAVLGGVSEAEKRWLFDHAALVIAPTTYEGFGLVPFEAAEAGVPCLFAPQASLAEVLPRELALIEPWDAARTADCALSLLKQPEERKRLVDAIRAVGARYTWDRTGEGLLEVYREAVEAPAIQLDADLSRFRDPEPEAVVHRGLVVRATAKALGFWGYYGVARGTWQGGRALVRKLARRVIGRLSPARA